MKDDASNPIFDHAARGARSETESDWHQAIFWYSRALACLPNLYGTDKMTPNSTIGGTAPIPFKPRHAGRIYSALGRCLCKLKRTEDSYLAYCAALSLDAENGEARRFVETKSGILEGRNAPDTPSVQDVNCLDAMRRNSGFEDSVTLIVVTHCTRGLKKFESLAPPSNRLVTATYGSLVNVFGEEISKCRKVLCYDHNPMGSEMDSQYLISLEHFSSEQGFELQTYPHVGLFNIMNRIIPGVDTPYIFFVEHDWMFTGGSLSLGAIVGMLNDDARMHSIRFNKRANRLDGNDFIMDVQRPQKHYPLLRTSSHSNNPCVIRTRKMRDEWLPICDAALKRVSKDLGGSAYGIEEILFKRHVEDIREDGFQKAHSKWGTYVFGRVGDPPRVLHLGE